MKRYIFGLSGTHGTGKSTIVAGVKEVGLSTKEVQISRSVQAQLGWDSLERVKDSVADMWQFQDAILATMYDRDRSINDAQGKITLVERTPIDAWAYAVAWCHHYKINVMVDKKACYYKQQCNSMLNEYNTVMVIPAIKEVLFEEDVHRAKLDNRKLVENTISNYIEEKRVNHYLLSSISKQDRINETVSLIQFQQIILNS